MSPQEWFWIFDMRRSDREHVRLRYDPALLAMIGHVDKPRRELVEEAA